jgi:hypothetical protein
MAAEKPENTNNIEMPPAQVTAENLGVPMTGTDFNKAHEAMKPGTVPSEAAPPLILTDHQGADHGGQANVTVEQKADKTYTPTTHSDIWHDLSIKGKNDYGAWAEREGERLGLVENDHDVKEQNAFRHVMTAALFTLKYGGAATSELGWANEQKDFNIVSSYEGKINLDKISDTNVDLLNNQSGIAIARELIKEKGEGNVTITDLEKKVIEEMKAGKLATHPDAELRSGRLASEILSYHSMAGLIKWESENGPTEEDRAKASEIVKLRHIE